MNGMRQHGMRIHRRAVAQRITLVALLIASACGERAVESDRTFHVGTLTIREIIERVSTLHDPVYTPRYEVQHGSDRVDLGGYRDESNLGVRRPPFSSGDALVVLSGAHALVLTPISGPLSAARTVWLSPHDAPCFTDGIGSNHGRVNGPYDLEATDADLDGAEWRFTYRRATSANTSVPAMLTFRSVDTGRSLEMENCERVSAGRASGDSASSTNRRLE